MQFGFDKFDIVCQRIERLTPFSFFDRCKNNNFEKEKTNTSLLLTRYLEEHNGGIESLKFRKRSSVQ